MDPNGAAGSVLSPSRTPNRPPMQPNVTNVVLGSLHIRPWFPSFYPEDLIGGRKTEWLYVCRWCFKYTSEIMKYSAHCKVCPLKDEPPPGDLIYDKDEYIIHQIDGEEHKLYTQNLSLLSKLWLDTKSVFFDVSTFLYYPLILRTEDHPYGQVVGFFSKEKMSWDNNNVACILVFPPWQRRGFGQVLMAASYELGRREARFGGPERPLSDLGRKGYISFWCGEVYRYILSCPSRKTVTIKAISEATYIMPEDLVAALREMDVLETRKTATGSVVVHKGKLRAWAERQKVAGEPLVARDAFVEEEAEELSEEEGGDEEEEHGSEMEE
ncbi:putative MYST (SAS MOZ) family protein [Teratosphaeria destructans]|uniref:histone acetyltransferase n=1 Tax=Teratosphaeria destructans TaxID=418781 RepID=A0A9W7SS18_9PEZI|nr:putative MYST (SAS MOZ) family protein [Teratosphaeria destructans]